MKKTFIAVIILIATCTIGMAQPRAIGGRVGWGISPSYQHAFGESNMLQVDLDFFGFYWGIQAVATYNWIFPINSWSGAGSWNWYAGVGGGLGLGWLSGFFVGAAGMIGVEYNFNFPLQLSLDWRPLIGPWFGDGGGAGFYLGGLYTSAVAVGARYRF